jgi:hypothetical protein
VQADRISAASTVTVTCTNALFRLHTCKLLLIVETPASPKALPTRPRRMIWHPGVASTRCSTCVAAGQWVWGDREIHQRAVVACKEVHRNAREQTYLCAGVPHVGEAEV